jgi:hypothetical protein
MITLDQEIQIHPDVVDTELDEGVVLLQLESKTYYSLNLTGTRIWQDLKQGQPLREISRRLQSEFEVDAATADRSVFALVNELYQQQLVKILS